MGCSLIAARPENKTISWPIQDAPDKTQKKTNLCFETFSIDLDKVSRFHLLYFLLECSLYCLLVPKWYTNMATENPITNRQII